MLRVIENKDTGDIKLQAEAGDAAAQEKLAGRLEGGFYYREAAKWYRKAAEAGRVESQFRLGNLLLKGRPQMGPDKPALAAQPGTAIGWLSKAAEQDHGLAQKQLGDCYLAGTGVSPNKVQAYKWYILAADHLIFTRGSRDRLALTLTTAQIEEGKRLAARFKAGERSESRIQIVTQAEPVAPENIAPPATVTPAVRAAPAPAAPVKRPSLTRLVAQTAGASQTTTAGLPKRGVPGDLIKGVIFTIATVGVLAVIARIALHELIGRLRQRRKRAGRPDDGTGDAPMDVAAPSRPPSELERLQTIDWFQFEKLMALLFAREGYQVDRRGGAVPDGGVDLELSRDDVRTAVQCKHWRNQQVGVKEVREFLGAMAAGRFEQGVFVAISSYTREAVEFARQNRIDLVDRNAMLALLEKHNAKYDPELAAALDGADKRCPKCEERLVRREAKRGANAGGWFWGCSTYPRCRYRLST